MEKNNDLITVIEELLEADMTEPKKIKNPQNKIGEEEQVAEAQDKTDKSIAANKLSSTAKPKADNASDNSSEVIGSEKGAAMDAGGDKDVGKMDKGKLPSDAADNSSEVLGSEKGAAMDAGGDKDVGKMGSKEKGNPSDASAEVEADKGPHNQAMDESDEVEEDAIEEADQDKKIVKNANDDQLPDEEKESMKNMKEGSDKDEDEDSDDDDSDEEMKEELDWDWEKIDSLSEEEFNELVDTLTEDELSEFNNHYESLVEDAEEVEEAAKDKGDMDKDGIDEPDDKEYMDNKDKAIKAAMKEESKESDEEDDDDEDEDDSMDEATGEKLEKAPSVSNNEPMRPSQEKGDNSPTDKGGNPGEGPHDQSNDPNETPTKANPKKAVKEETVTEEEEEIVESIEDSLEEDFKEKAKVIFETAVNEKTSLIREEIEAEYAQMLEEKVNEVNERVNEYVDYVVNEWLEDNQLEIKYSLRTEIAENFIRGMKGLFEENFIDIPEEEVSVVDELTEAVESYKEQLEEQATALDSAKKELLEIKRKEIVEAIGNDLPQTQKIRLEKLSENVDADDIDEFRYKVEQLKEGYFDESSEQPLLSSLSEEVFGGTVIEEDDSSVSQYAKFLSKTVTK